MTWIIAVSSTYIDGIRTLRSYLIASAESGAQLLQRYNANSHLLHNIKSCKTEAISLFSGLHTLAYTL